MTQDSAAKRREDVDEVAARGLMGAKRRGGGTVQSWVKPEVDPPIGCALPREVVTKSFEWMRLGASRLRRDTGFIVSHDPRFSREAASEGSMTVSVV
jgi:hypothetical protein